MTKKIALQLWSVQNDAEIDLLGTLEKVREMGYDGVEFAGYFDHSSTEIRQKLDQLGLAVAGSHIPIERLIGHLDEVIQFEKEIGNHEIVCPYSDFETEKEWRLFARELREIGKKIKANGLAFSYHNHAHELNLIQGQSILQFLLDEVPDLQAEFDTYWLAFAGMDVPAFIAPYKGRMPLIHLKDRSGAESIEIGAGDLPIKHYINQAKKCGTEWLIIEQEAFPNHPPMESVAIGYRNLCEILREDEKE
ncbi:sugar phosphate isomerase/epimerase family protein [Listeria ilorinensis]|uniref:sugar phosphate isomerase/epimerase family protein n=1 Tax=Listeria ilorinensis TaxID=2867439 RepID=UPI001EF40A4A|nr:sugar phosphate isomerase/epimerase [Listeria ilorinensis]